MHLPPHQLHLSASTADTASPRIGCRSRPSPPDGRRKFTLVEIALALSVMALGVLAILSLMPIAFGANRQAVSRNSAADAGDQMLHLLTSSIKADWSLMAAIPTERYDGPDTGINWSTGSLVELNNLKVQFAAVNDTDDFDPAVHQTGLFRLTQLSSTNHVEFDGIARLWRVDAEGFEAAEDGDGEMFSLVAEISWPSQLPYHQRDTSVFSLDAYRPSLRTAMSFPDPGERVFDNAGNGNNEDGVDVSNPGQGDGGPNGIEDPSGTIDDEVGPGNTSGGTY